MTVQLVPDTTNLHCAECDRMIPEDVKNCQWQRCAHRILQAKSHLGNMREYYEEMAKRKLE